MTDAETKFRQVLVDGKKGTGYDWLTDSAKEVADALTKIYRSSSSMDEFCDRARKEFPKLTWKEFEASYTVSGFGLMVIYGLGERYPYHKMGVYFRRESRELLSYFFDATAF